MCYVCVKEMRSTVVDEGVLIFFILVPLLYPLLYSWIYNNQVVREVPVAIVDNSNSAMSRQFIRNLDASPDVQVASRCTNMDEARQLIGKQAVHGIINFPADFQTRLLRGQQSTVSVYCDMSIMLYYKAIYQTATSVSGEMNSGIQVRNSGGYTSRDDELTVRPLDYAGVSIFNTTGGYGDFIIPGVLLLILHQTLLLGIGLGAGTARENNRYRDLVPVSRHYNGIFRIVLGKSLCYFMIYILMGGYITMVVPRLFGYVQLIGARELIGIMVPFVLATIFFGMMMSCTIRYRENVMLIVVFTSVPFLFFSGISWPQSSMPGIWQSMACLFPSTFGVRAFVRLNTMGATLSDVETEYQALWIQVLVYFFMTCIVYRYQINQAHKHAEEHIQRMKDKLQVERQKRAARRQAGSNP